MAAVPLTPAVHQRSHGRADDDDAEPDQAGLTGDPLRRLVGPASAEPEQDGCGRPQHAASDVVDSEGAVRHPRDPGQSRYQCPKPCGEATDEDRAAAQPAYKCLGPLDPVDASEPARQVRQQPLAEPAAKGVAD